jgi:RNA polymerase sigma factor (TIGR02999 family)
MFSERTSLAHRSIDERYSLVYEELHRIAAAMCRSESHHSIRPTALVDDAWLKLRHSPQLADTSLGHFKAIAAGAMRQVLVEEARRRNAQKRGDPAHVIFLTLGEEHQQIAPVDVALLDLDTALDELAELNSRHSAIVENMFFGDMTVAEVAETLGVSKSLVERDWRAAKAWLAARIRRSNGVTGQ